MAKKVQTEPATVPEVTVTKKPSKKTTAQKTSSATEPAKQATPPLENDVVRNAKFAFQQATSITVEVVKIKNDAKIPSKEARDIEDAGWDLYTNERRRIPGHTKYAIGTGIALGIPAGWVGKIRNRSSVALSTPLMVDAGVIDPGYRGEIKIVLVNTGEYPFDIEKGQKIAQILFEPIPNVTMASVKELSKSDRGAAGFGSTGK